MSQSTFEGFAPREAAWRSEVFCIRYFSNLTKHKSIKTITEQCFFMSKQVSLPKITLIVQKMRLEVLHGSHVAWQEQ